jgi:hypothetical protein
MIIMLLMLPLLILMVTMTTTMMIIMNDQSASRFSRVPRQAVLGKALQAVLRELNQRGEL